MKGGEKPSPYINDCPGKVVQPTNKKHVRREE
jgi:hypothetical protein